MPALALTPGYRELPPPPALRDLVACFWIRVAGDADAVRIVPDGCTDVVWLRGDGVTVAGPDTTPKVSPPAPGDVFVGMRFRPSAGGGALGLPLDEIRDLRVEAADVDAAFDVHPELAPEQVLAHFAATAADREPDPLVTVAADRLANEDVRAIARELWVSERQLRRRFHAAVGYGPKTLARVLRFQRFVRAVDSGRTDLAAIASRRATRTRRT